jgi:hypothetical protein
MSAPLSSSEPKRSEYSHGRGLSTHPLSDAQTIRGLPWKTEPGKHDAETVYRGQLRSDPTNGDEDLSTMPFVKGNPDMFGPSLPLVRESQYEPPAVYPQPVLRYGVDRQD